MLDCFKLGAVPTVQSLGADSRNARPYTEGGNLLGQMEALKVLQEVTGARCWAETGR